MQIRMSSLIGFMILATRNEEGELSTDYADSLRTVGVVLYSQRNLCLRNLWMIDLSHLGAGIKLIGPSKPEGRGCILSMSWAWNRSP